MVEFQNYVPVMVHASRVKPQINYYHEIYINISEKNYLKRHT